MKCENVWTSAVVKHYQMFQLSATVPNLCPQLNSSVIIPLIEMTF